MEYHVLLIENNRIMLERLSSVIKNTKDFELLGRYPKASDALWQGGVFQPNLVLLDVDTEENTLAVPEFCRAFAGAAVICMSSRWNAENSSHMVRAGARGFLIKPFTGEELIEAVTTFGKSGMAVMSDVMAFFSPKGKSGKTTLIANLALSLARKSSESVGIIDADGQFGDMAVFFNLSPQSTIVEAVRDIGYLSPITLRPYFVPVNEGVSVLCGTKKPEQAEMIEPQALTDVIRMARSLFRYVLIDLPPGFNPTSIAAAELSDITYMVAMVSGSYEIQHMQRALEIFKDWPDYQQRVRVVFTRVEPCDSASRQHIEEELGYPVEAILPNEYLLVSAAANNGRMALDIKPDVLLTHNINRMADKIIGKKRIRWDKP